MLGESVALRLIRGKPDVLSAESYVVRIRIGLFRLGFDDSVDRFSIRVQYGAGAMARLRKLPNCEIEDKEKVELADARVE